MTGSIQKKKNRKNYYAVINIYDDNGTRKPKWIDTGIPIKGNNKREANAKLKEILAIYEAGVDLSNEILFVDFMAQWLETRLNTKAIVPTTYDGYKLIFESQSLFS